MVYIIADLIFIEQLPESLRCLGGLQGVVLGIVYRIGELLDVLVYVMG